MDKNEIQKKIMSEEDYIRCPKFSNSLTKFLEKFSDGVEDSKIARVLMISEEKVKQLYEDAVEKLHNLMKKNEK